MVKYKGKYKTAHTTHIQTRGKRSTHTTSSIGGGGGKRFKHYDKGNHKSEYPKAISPIIEETLFGYCFGITIYNLLNSQKKKGVAVIFVGEDLDVLIELCDRILVIGSGYITGVVDARNTTKEEIGLLMTKTVSNEGKESE